MINSVEGCAIERALALLQTQTAGLVRDHGMDRDQVRAVVATLAAARAELAALWAEASAEVRVLARHRRQHLPTWRMEEHPDRPHPADGTPGQHAQART
jgi:hypothetical protein